MTLNIPTSCLVAGSGRVLVDLPEEASSTKPITFLPSCVTVKSVIREPGISERPKGYIITVRIGYDHAMIERTVPRTSLQ